MGIAGRQHFDFSVRQCGFVNIFAGAYRRFAGHYLRSELLLAFHELIQVGIKGFFRHETVDVNLCIFVALPDTSAEPLFQVRGSPRAVEIGGCGKFVLHIRTGSHLLRTAHQDADIPSAYLLEQLQLLCFGISFVDEPYLIGRYATGNQLLSNVVIDIEGAIVFRRRQVAEE